MKSHWSEAEVAQGADDLELRVYSSRLLGSDPSLVLHGGGNTSVKLSRKNILGETEEILFVKGSGWDLATIQAEGFSPVRLESLRKLATLDSLTDQEMVAEFLANMTRHSAPTPSVEAILHAILPFKYVDHTHADAIVAITNSLDGQRRIQEVYGSDVVVIPYVMPGFDLARKCAEIFARESTPETRGMVLLNHGIFSFGSTARESYERMIELVTRAEDYLRKNNAWEIDAKPRIRPEINPLAIAQLRKEVAGAAGCPMILSRHADDKSLAFVQRPDLAEIATRGPATPDHVIRTKAKPMIRRDVAAYVSDYRRYFAEQELSAAERKTCLDPAPRVILDAELGVLTAGKSAADAAVARDIYSHTIEVISRATALGGYRALPESDLFAVEYWDLEQAKLARAPRPGMFAGEIALVTGAASGIGRSCVDSFLSRGAAVVGLDIDSSVEEMHAKVAFLGLRCDVTDEKALAAAFARGVDAFGGCDMLVLNAGIFPRSRKIAELNNDEWAEVMRVNLDANMMLLRAAHPFLKLAPRGGRTAVVGSKNVAAPGPGAAAYSASKAALNQLARVATLEWARDNIRVNSVHPHGIFDTGIWTDEVIASRARDYGMPVDEYRKNNLLGTTITSKHVAEVVAELCGPLFEKCTGLHIPIDGGSDRII